MLSKDDIKVAMRKYSNMKVTNEHGKEDCLCDKAKHHCYDEFYPDLLEKYLNRDNLTILEIGAYYGGSILLWEELFPTSKIYAIDWNFNNLKVDLNRENITKIQISQTDPKIKKILKDVKFDIIIDDGSHQAADQIGSFQLLSDQLNDDGVYVIEDIYPEHINNKKYPASFLSKFKHVDLSGINGRGDDRLFVYTK